ncbi:hypothetical protein [Micromonospora carbonacea]|uniref:Terminase small subunit n=1 Tax=Micromonospora carbonacea TaxID=47853 RepID=A0A1C5AC48_9ACTN|nr:hypothetical protein [Micromonospora carbonacea]SCF42797.1 hypothetical protein GA0070563_112132 [Micromonospora carbonacea]
MAASKAQRAQVAKRRAEAVAMRMTGASFQAIADALGYSSRGAACQDVTRALEAAIAEQTRATDIYREEELQRLDLLLAEAWAVLKRQHVTVSHGRVIRDEDTDQPLIDDGPTLAAIDRVLKIQERRAKFLGLDAPTKVEAITIDALDAEIAKLSAELDEQPATSVPQE